MKLAVKLLLVFPLSLAIPAFGKGKARSTKGRYPVISAVQGEAFQVENEIAIANREPVKSVKEKLVRKGAVLKDKAILRTPEAGELWIELNPYTKIVIAPKSKVEIPGIAWQDGKVDEIRLLSGSVRYICEVQCDRKVITGLSEQVPPVGDYVYSYDPSVPKVTLSVVTGEIAFRGFENENSVVLHAGESASFTGALENNEPAFDVLLKGRRVAKGNLSEVQKLSAEDLEQLKKQIESQKKAQAKVPKTTRLASQICEKPWGELNQCLWTCEKNKKNAKECLVEQGAQCIRTRCNANGIWADRQELSASESKCKIKPYVAACDY